MSGQDAGTLKDKTQAFLSEFFQRGESLVRELIEENERLKEALRSGDKPAFGDLSPMPATVVERLMTKVDRLESECAEIRRIAGSVRRESGDYRNRLDALEMEHYQLATVYVAANQFHAAVTVEEVLRTVTEILLNFVGIGQFTIYCADETRNEMFPIAREGGDLAERQPISMADPILGSVLNVRAVWRPGDPRGKSKGVIMQLPLIAGDRAVGIVHLEQFLPQKKSFGDSDHGLLELISEHAGIAIEAAWVRTHAKDEPLCREAVESLVGA